MKQLSFGIKNNSGRNNTGRITVNGIGGGNKIKYNLIDFHRRTDMAQVVAIYKDSNRTTNIGLIRYLKDNFVSQILLAKGVQVNDIINNGGNLGSSVKISQLPLSTIISNIELIPNKGAVLARAASTSATIISKSDTHVKIKIKKKYFDILGDCIVTVGVMSSNITTNNYKAGQNRWANIRPRVKNYAKNPRDRK